MGRDKAASHGICGNSRRHTHLTQTRRFLFHKLIPACLGERYIRTAHQHTLGGTAQQGRHRGSREAKHTDTHTHTYTHTYAHTYTHTCNHTHTHTHIHKQTNTQTYTHHLRLADEMKELYRSWIGGRWGSRLVEEGTELNRTTLYAQTNQRCRKERDAHYSSG